MSILLHRSNNKTYKIFILFDDELKDYEEVKNNKKFLEEWVKDLKKELNKQYKIVFDRLESLKELRGEIEPLNKSIDVNGEHIPLFSDRLNKKIRIIFSVFTNPNTIVVWGIDYHEKAYGEIIRRAISFIKNQKNQKNHR
jgi:peptidoglycan hydrolase CwlO-like protein